MSKKAQNTSEHGFETIESALSKTEQYIEDNQKSLTIIVIAIAVVIGIFLGYKRFILTPAEEDAKREMFGAEQYFEKDSFNLALYGDGNYMGFIDIIEDYGITKAANLASYYAGISYLKLGEYEDAIDYLKKFDSNDILVSSMAKGSIGDAYVELEEYTDAISYYESAADDNPNEFTSPIYLMKLARVYEKEGELNKALEVYKKIESEYPDSEEGSLAVKYITKVEAQL
jgi:tetratricopeptide (TPR) repeat protein